MSLKLIAMVVVRKKMEKVMMMVWVCCWHENEGEKEEDKRVMIFVEGVVVINLPIGVDAALSCLLIYPMEGVAHFWPLTLAPLITCLSNLCRIISLNLSCVKDNMGPLRINSRYPAINLGTLSHLR